MADYYDPYMGQNYSSGGGGGGGVGGTAKKILGGVGSVLTGGLAGPVIGGVATLGGAALGGKAQKKAAQLQAQTADKTLAFAKDQEAYKRQAYEQATEAARQQYNAAQARRDALLASYGFDVPAAGNLFLGSPQTGVRAAAPQGYSVPQQAQAVGVPVDGIRSLMSTAPEAARPRVSDTGRLGDVYLAPWGSGNWSE